MIKFDMPEIGDKVYYFDKTSDTYIEAKVTGIIFSPTYFDYEYNDLDLDPVDFSALQLEDANLRDFLIKTSSILVDKKQVELDSIRRSKPNQEFFINMNVEE